MKVFSKKSRRIFLCLLVCGIVAFACFAAYPACNAKKESEPQPYRGVLRVWHIDSFEGGTGSRAAFLRNAAKTFEQESGMYVLVTAHTAESAAPPPEAYLAARPQSEIIASMRRAAPKMSESLR